ncbi:MAG: DUF2232 domain-containing protein [Candidatus Binataceae bacterium]
MTRKAFIGMIRAASLAGALFVAGGAIPFVGGIAMLFAPAPILIYAVGRIGARVRSLGSVAIAAILVSLVAGPYVGAAYLVSLGLTTVLIAEMLEAKRSFEAIVPVATLAMFIAIALAALLAHGGSFDALVGAMRVQIGESMVRGEQFYKLFGITTEVPAQTRASILDTVLLLVPAIAAIIASTIVLLNLLLFWRWVGKQRLSYTLFGNLSKWSAPDWLVWLLLVTGFGWFVPLGPVQDIALNGFLSIAAIYFCQGIAIIAFYFQVLSVPGFVRAIAYVFAVAQPVLAALVCLAGIFDMWVDFRRLKPPGQEAGSLGGDFM